MRYYIFDIDGTLSDAGHRVHFITSVPKDWDSFHEAAKDDFPIQQTVNILDTLYKAGYNIALATGRREAFRESTEEWMRRHYIRYSRLFMRKDGDRRDDALVKKEMYLRNIQPLMGDALGVFEDRSRVVSMWRSLGLICYQVCKGDY